MEIILTYGFDLGTGTGTGFDWQTTSSQEIRAIDQSAVFLPPGLSRVRKDFLSCHLLSLPNKQCPPGKAAPFSTAANVAIAAKSLQLVWVQDI